MTFFKPKSDLGPAASCGASPNAETAAAITQKKIGKLRLTNEVRIWQVATAAQLGRSNQRQITRLTVLAFRKRAFRKCLG